jgi:hypothetical protein
MTQVLTCGNLFKITNLKSNMPFVIIVSKSIVTHGNKEFNN